MTSEIDDCRNWLAVIADGLKKDFKRRLKGIKEQYKDEPKKMRIIRYKPEKKKRKPHLKNSRNGGWKRSNLNYRV